MSRSLDKAVLASLQTQDPRPAYKDISALFHNDSNEASPSQSVALLEIEFLGTSHPLEDGVNYLRDESAVAIPKLRLAQAFSVARQIFQGYLLSKTTATTSVPENVLAATAVLLLMDPEHLTAANARKRALQHKLASLARGDDGHASQRLRAVQAEKHFVDSLLTSRLHRHTKSPTLWGHRQWLLKLCHAEALHLDLKDDFINIIMVSGERHPRNYYAWNHARLLLLRQSSEIIPSAGEQQQQQLEKLCHNVKNWCLKHHGDISGWTFLASVLGQIHDREQKAVLGNSIMRDVLRITESFRWSSESVWVFLRGLVATHDIELANLAWFQKLKDTLGH